MTTTIGSYSQSEAVAVQPDGKVVVTGIANNRSSFLFAAARFLRDSTSRSTALAATATAPTTNAPEATLVSIVLEQSVFPDYLTSKRQRRTY